MTLHTQLLQLVSLAVRIGSALWTTLERDHHGPCSAQELASEPRRTARGKMQLLSKLSQSQRAVQRRLALAGFRSTAGSPISTGPPDGQVRLLSSRGRRAALQLSCWTHCGFAGAGAVSGAARLHWHRNELRRTSLGQKRRWRHHLRLEALNEIHRSSMWSCVCYFQRNVGWSTQFVGILLLFP